MSDEIIKRDENHITVLAGITDDADQFVTMMRLDPTSKRLLVAATGVGAGTVTNVSVVSANGFSGSVANDSTTPAITLSTTITGLLQGNGTAMSAVTIGAGLSFSSGTLSSSGVTDVIIIPANGLTGSVATSTTTPTITLGTTLTNGSVPFIDTSAFAEDNANFRYDSSLVQLALGPLDATYNYPEAIVTMGGYFGGIGSADFLGPNIRNTSPYGSSDYIIANDADDGTLTGTYGDFGIAGSTYVPSGVGDSLIESNDVYLYSSTGAGNLNIFTIAPDKTIRFATVGNTVDQMRLEIADDRTSIFANKDVEIVPALTNPNWTEAGGWGFGTSPNRLILSSNAGPNTIEPTVALSIAPGVTYRVTIDASATSGTISYTLGGVPGTMIVTGTTTDFITATGVGNLIITGAASATATITGISIRPLIADTGNLVVEGAVILGSGIEVTSGASVMTVDGNGVATFSEIPFIPATLPTLDYQAAPKIYVDTFAQGLTPISFCDLVTTGSNITLSGEQTIDGVLTSASRVMVKDQTLTKNNGIYISGAGAWTRATDYDTTAEIRIGQFALISQGSTYAGYRFVQYLFNPAVDVLGTDPIGFTALSQIPIFTASLGVQLVGSNFQADYDNVTIGLTGNHLQVKNNGITYAKMQAVSTTSKLLGSSSTTTPVQEISLGAGLSMSGTTLSATGVAGTGTDNHIVRWNGTTAVQDSELIISDIAGGVVTMSTLSSELQIEIPGGTTGNAFGVTVLPAVSGSGGFVTLTSGDGAGSSTGGTVNISSGSGGATGLGGAFIISAGNGGSTSGNGGTLRIYGGGPGAFAGNNDGGDIWLTPGHKTGSGSVGKLRIYPSGGASYSANLDSSLMASSDKTFTFPNLTGTFALTTNNLSIFAATTSAQLAGIISDETGTGALVFANTPTLINPALGVATGTSLAVSGALTSSGTAGIGYATGAGGTVTQLTSKSTGVTLNKICGQITMNNASLAAGAEVAFTLTNNAVAATDIVVVNVQSVGTAGSYLVTVGAVGAGSCSITISNASAGALAQAVVLNFAVIKSKNA